MPELSALIFATAISMLYRSLIPVIAPELSQALLLSDAQLGNLAALFFIGFAAVQIPVGLALDRLGPRLTITTFMLLALAGTALFATATEITEAYIAQLMIGMGCAPIMTGSMVVISRRFSPERFAFMTAVVLTLANLGDLFSTAPFAWLSEQLGWRGALWVVLALTLVSALACLLLIGRDRQAPGCTPETPGQLLKGMVQVARLQVLWPMLPLMLTGYACLMTVRGLWAGPWLADQYLLTAGGRGQVLFALSLAMTLGMFLYGVLDRRGVSRKRLIMGGSLVTSAALILLALPQLPLWAAVATLVLTGLTGYTYALIVAHCRSFIPAQLMGRAVAFLTLTAFLGVGLLQAFSGWLMQLQTGYSPLFLTLALILLTSTFCYRFSCGTTAVTPHSAGHLPAIAEPSGRQP